MFNQTEYMKRYRREHKEYLKQKHQDYIDSHPNYRKNISIRRVLFKDRRIKLKENPRKGICSNCGKSGHTNLHHKKYDDNDPLANTIELCVGCHRRAHKIEPPTDE